MALSYDDMMFECILDNTENSKLTQKKTKISKTSKTLKTSKNTYFNNTKSSYKKMGVFYKPYKNIKDFYDIVNNIIKDTNNDDSEDRKHYYLSSHIVRGIYTTLLYTHTINILLCINNENNSFFNNISKSYDFIKNDTKTPKYLLENREKFISFYDNNIKNNNIIIDNFKIIPLLNDYFINKDFVRVIDIFKRYFDYFINEYENKSISFYVANEHSNFNFDTNNINNIIFRTNNLVKSLNYYLTEKINYFDIYYQNNNSKIQKLSTVSYSSFNVLNKINILINYEPYGIINNDVLINYINNKLMINGSVILFFSALTPIKSILVKRLSTMFKKIIITKTTLDPTNFWVLICKGYSLNKKKYNIEKIDKFINYSFNKYTEKTDKYYKNTLKLNLTNKELITEINKRYIEIYKWSLKNNIPVINIYSDFNKKPELIKENNLTSYLFPNQKGINKSDIKLFNFSLYSVTPPNESKKISNTIKNIFLGFFKLSYNEILKLCITDGTANVGGNTLNFSDNFIKVNTIEINSEVFEALKHNCINVYHRKNIIFHQGDCTKIIPTLKQDIIFIDPPWNGAFYKAYDKLHLFLGDNDVVDIIKEWYDKKLARLYVIKCPANFDFDPFIINYKQLFIEKLKNYNLIYIINVT